MSKKKCPIQNKFCERHEFYHGGEAQELREGVEEILREHKPSFDVEDYGDNSPYQYADYINEIRERLQDLLDKVDARDSLAMDEAQEEEEDED